MDNIYRLSDTFNIVVNLSMYVTVQYYSTHTCTFLNTAPVNTSAISISSFKHLRYSTAQTQVNKQVQATHVTRNITREYQASNLSVCVYTQVMHCLHTSRNSRALNSRTLARTCKLTHKYLQIREYSQKPK